MANGKLYTPEEDAIVMDPYLMAKEAAEKLNRSVNAIEVRRKIKGYKSLRPKSKGTEIFPVNATIEPIPTWPYNMLIKAFIIDGEEPLSDIQLAGLNKAMECFSERERVAVELYFQDELTLNECGERMGVTRERIRQIISKALRKLRHPTRANLIVYGEDIRNHNHYLEHLREVKEAIKEIEAYIEEHKEIYTQFVKDGTEPGDPDDIPLDELDLSVRSYNALKRKGIKYASEVEALMISGEIAKVRNLGRKSYLEIVERLKEKGFDVEVKP